MAERIVKSVLWMIGCTGLGYGLLITTTQKDSDINELKKELRGVEKHPVEALKKKEQFVHVLQTATSSNRPLYRLDKEGIDKELKRQ